MRIALVCDWYRPRVGGIELHLEILAGRLAAAGHDVTVITPTPGAVVNSGGFRVQRIRTCLFPGFGFIWTPAAFRRLKEALRSGGFDVVHAHSSIISPTANGSLYFAHKLGRPAVVTVHSIWGKFRAVLTAFDRPARWTRWPVVFSAVSERVARDMRPILTPAPVAILPNAVEPADWRIAPRTAVASEVAVVCAMRLFVKKRGRALFAVLPDVLRRLPPGVRFRLRLAGDGPERPALERLARRLGLGEAVEFLGQLDRDRVKALYAASDFFVLPTVREAFGIAALEARAAGLPVVAMRAGGVGEFIRHGEDGLLADDDRELAGHLVRLATDLPLRERIAAHNRATPVAFTWERSLAAHLEVYEQARRLRMSARP